MAKEKKQTEEQTVEETAVAVQTTGFAVSEIDESEYEANFAFAANEKAISFLKQAQALSPELDRDNAVYVKGLEKGGFFVSGTGKVFNEGCYMIPCYMVREHIFWKPNQGGFDSKALWTQEVQDQLVRDGSKNFLPDGRQVEDAFTYYVLVVDPENPNQMPIPAIFKCASTKATVARKLNTLLNTMQFENKLPGGSLPAIFRFLISITSVAQVNSDQQKFYNVNFAVAKEHPYLNAKGLVAVKDLLDLAKNFADLASADGVKVDHDADRGDAQSSGTTGGGLI